MDPCADAFHPCAVVMPEAMVDGETITEEEASGPGWIDAIRRRAKSSTTTTGKPARARPDTRTAYVAASGTTSRGVVRGVDADLPDSELQRLFVSSHNPTLMGVRRIKDTTTIILLFDGLRVPNYVRCGMLLLRCTLYKRQIDICRNCGRVGHRQVVCPTPSEKVCEHCGIKPTGPDHECVTPECALCGQAHITGDRTCPNRYQVPYVVRRRHHRRCRCNNQQTQEDSATQQPKPTPKQPSPTPPTKHLPTTTKNPTATPTWADRVSGKGEAPGYAKSDNLSQHENDEIRELKRELALLRKENEEFKALITNMQQPSERAVETPTPAVPAVERASTTSSNANRAAKRPEADNPLDEPVTIPNSMEALARLRADIAADHVADMTPHTL
ncbi:hypothetical protein HPB51_002698 [Rhipicephalus microplus]|uniref:CCHC-type domain-containing protein n=1 Tax=Rhipicephalus microplus TaxID=6941 RepID=A0A9J6E5Q6_RHIMP|nr:hypothetical protein HPB51_002698 [Rhipicephalus microplus]